MSMKKWLFAIGIIGILAIAFFWGGNSPNSSNKPAASNLSSQISPVAQPTKAPDRQDGEIQATASLLTEEQQQMDSPPPKAEATKVPQPTQAAEEKTPAPQVAASPTVKPASSVPSMPSAKPVPQKTAEPKKDKYLTDPVPEGKPKPVELKDVKINKKKSYTATLSVSAKTILDNMSSFNEDKLEVLPADGVIYKAQTVTFYEGESVFDVLLREMRKHKIHLEFSMTPIYNSSYIEGIHNIYEFDCGELSGWMYKVNGWFPNYGASRYSLKDGDVIDWVYTCDLGRDIGGSNAASGGKE